MPSKKGSETRFTQALRALVADQLEKGYYANSASFAKDLRIGKPRLSRLLSGKDVPGTKTVAWICSKLDRPDAANLLQAFLLDEVETVTRLSAIKVKPSWAGEQLVVVSKATKPLG